MEDNRIPVTIITGFLGSGKTTLLNKLIEKYKDKKFAIIENEFGEIGIDGGLIVGANEKIFELSNGCICCSLNDDFYKTINQLISGNYVFNHLLIETTGIADPDSIIKAFLSTNEIQMQFRLDSVICLADAINMEDLMNEQAEVRKQLALSDIVLLNKIDAVQPNYVHELVRIIKGINTTAQVYPVSHANISDINILNTFSFSLKEIEKTTLSFWNLKVVKKESIPQPSVLVHKKEHQHDIKSEGFIIPGDFDFGKFNFWLNNFRYISGDNIFRVKGIISFNRKREKYIFQAIRSTYVLEIGEPWGNETRISKLIFIGKHIDRDFLEDTLYQLLYKEKKLNILQNG